MNMKYIKLYENYSKRSVEDFIKENNIKKDVTGLYCRNNKLESLKGVENLINLTELYCSNNKLESLKGIENLTNLTGLYCHINKLESLKGVENLTNLTGLDCSSNQLESLSGIENLTNLTKLYCYNNKLESLKGVENLINLTELYCYNNPIKYLVELPNDQLDVNRVYGTDLVNKFKTYEFQREFLKEHPENVGTLKPFGFHKDIKIEFPVLVRGAEWGFFDLKGEKNER